MDGILNLIQAISGSDSNAFQTFLKALNEHQSFRLNQTQASDASLQHIATLINKHDTCEHGLLLLEIVLKQCSFDVITQKGPFWVTLCSKGFHNKKSPNAASQAYKCLNLLMELSTEVPELSKAFSNQFVSEKFCETLCSTNSIAHFSALKCLESALKLYAGSCGSMRTAIEKFLAQFVDSTDSSLVISSGKCWHLLQQVKVKNVPGFNVKTAWESHQYKILGSLHGLLDILFENFPETYDEETGSQQLLINPLDLHSEPVQRSSQILTRFKNLISYLIMAFREPFPVPKLFAPKKVLNLITRGLNGTCALVDNNRISDNLAVGAIIPELHIELLKLLDVLILALTTHLALHAKTILNLIVGVLKWTSIGKPDGFPKPYKNLRIAAYNTLSLWCSTMKSASLCELIYDRIIEQITNDITPFYAEVTLKVLSGSRKYMTKKARRQLHKAQNQESNIVQTHSKGVNLQNVKKLYSDEENAGLCVSALKCLKNIIISSIYFLAADTVKDVQEKILDLCAQISENSNQKQKLYGNATCRLALYDVLYTLIISPHHLSPLPTQLSLNLLGRALKLDQSHIVRKTCLELMRNIEKVIHPQKETLYFPVDAHSVKNALKNYKKKSKQIEKYSSEDEIEIVSMDIPSDTEQKKSADEDCRIVEIIDSAYKDKDDNIESEKDNQIIILHESPENTSDVELVESLSHDHDNSSEKVTEIVSLENNDVICKIGMEKYNCNEEPINIDKDVSTCSDDEPISKKIRLNSERIEAIETVAKKSVDKETEAVKEIVSLDDTLLFEEIASSFVDELN